VGSARILVKHTGHINLESQGSRSRDIDRIFLETAQGERFLLPHKNLAAARAQARHISEGGTMHDEVSEHITTVVKEMSDMSRFVRTMSRRVFEDAETTEMVEAARERYYECRDSLHTLSGHRGYQSFMETFKPDTADQLVEDEVDLEALKERFVKKIFDDRLMDALPHVYRAYQRRKVQETRVGSEFESFMSQIQEVAAPEVRFKRSQIDKINERLSTRIPTGEDGFNGIQIAKSMFQGSADANTESLEDSIYHLAASQGSDADIRPLILAWFQSNAARYVKYLEFGPNNNDQAQANNPAQVSPDVAASPTGQTGMDDPNVNESLSLIRKLAGLVR
jgi:hypothetical protein